MVAVRTPECATTAFSRTVLHVKRCQRVGMPSWTRPLKACKKLMRACLPWTVQVGSADPGAALDGTLRTRGLRQQHGLHHTGPNEDFGFTFEAGEAIRDLA